MNFSGKTVFEGIAIGKIKERKIDEKHRSEQKHPINSVDLEIEKLENAMKSANTQLNTLYEKAFIDIGQDGADIIEIQKLMLEDEDFLNDIKEIIMTEKINAEAAIWENGRKYAEIFRAMDDSYMKERSADILDISKRLVDSIAPKKECAFTLTEPSIILADDLSPSETIQLDRSNVLAFVTRFGSTNSHTAILARTMNIPALVMTAVEGDVDGKTAIVDGIKGVMLIDPDRDNLEKYQKMLVEIDEKKKLYDKLRGVKTVTKDGKEIKLYANIGLAEDVDAVLSNDAEGIGLFRSEFIYLQSKQYPTEEEQFQIYRTVAEKMNAKPVIIRTLDIGADKKIDYFNLAKESNPALGYRAIRICLDNLEVFRTQLRALLRASAYGNLSIMIPMITSVWEIKEVKAVIKEVKADLENAGIPYQNVALGVMIETPAAVMVADLLAREVDFFSIGTNDLTQYTLAIDRQNAKLDKYYDPHHPAILKMIDKVIQDGHKEGIWVGICGELAADFALTKRFLEAGIDELSVSPPIILPLREIIMN